MDSNEHSDWDDIKKDFTENWGIEFQEKVKKRNKDALVKIILIIVLALILCYFL